MKTKYLNNYLSSSKYMAGEQNMNYKEIMDILSKSLDISLFLELEEKINFELVEKATEGFREGFRVASEIKNPDKAE
ncbi:hypothetical protein MUJ63_03185 [Lachnospiraceae bacterium NSJ-143]|nr:hypothetical protein [Lachnospiraceae bacterium NSJ-143]